MRLEIDKMRRALKVEAMPEVTIYANEAGLLKQDIDCVRTILECHLQARKLFEDIKDKSSVDDGFRIDEGFKKCFNTIKERKKEADTAVLDMNKGDLRNKAEELIGDVGAGKTTFTRGLAEGLGVQEPLSSPSFTIGRIPVTGSR